MGDGASEGRGRGAEDGGGEDCFLTRDAGLQIRPGAEQHQRKVLAHIDQEHMFRHWVREGSSSSKTGRGVLHNAGKKAEEPDREEETSCHQN